LFLRCAGPRLLPSTGLVTFTLVTLLSRYIRTNTDSSKLSIDRPARSGRAMHVPCASATSGQQRSVPRKRWPPASATSVQLTAQAPLAIW